MFKRLLNKFVAWLYELLETERKRRAAEDLKAVLEQRDRKQREFNDSHVREKQRRQEFCSHLKGGRGPKGISVDYSVSQHTFSDGQTVTRCLLCDKRFEGAEAERVMNRSSNTRTTSEQSLKFENCERPDGVVLSGGHQYKWLNGENEPLAPYISLSLWNRMMVRLAQLQKKRKKRGPNHIS
jgi:hypothetical protein